MTRNIQELGDVDVTKMVKWIKAIPFEDWPQQRPLDDGQLRPSMVTDLSWHDFGKQAEPIVRELGYDGSYQWMLSVVMPGHFIEAHKDQQPDYWKYRVHVPLVTNPKAVTHISNKDHHLEVGKAYRLNTAALHAVDNPGKTPRIHFMFDVK
jgi:hypothetical protein